MPSELKPMCISWYYGTIRQLVNFIVFLCKLL